MMQWTDDEVLQDTFMTVTRFIKSGDSDFPLTHYKDMSMKKT